MVELRRIGPGVVAAMETKEELESKVVICGISLFLTVLKVAWATACDS